jgi:hypothetical protein
VSKDFTVGDLPLPKRLLAFIDCGFWPRTSREEKEQILHPLVAREKILLFAPEEERIYFLKPPFCTLAEQTNGREDEFWSKFAAADGISPELAIAIGGFGPGLDSPILLDYQLDRSNPAVLRLESRKHEPDAWVRCANTFDDFADMLGLDHLQ